MYIYLHQAEDNLFVSLCTEKFIRKRIDAQCVEDMKMTYEFHYSKILETLSVNTANRFRDFENLIYNESF